MPGMDIFDSNAFSMQSLTGRLIDQPHVPMRISELGIFESAGIRTTKASIERQGNTLVLVQTSERGAPAQQNVKDARSLIDVPTARIALEDVVNADEVQSVRAFGSESELDTLVAEVDRRNARMSRSIDATEEHQRIGALKGQVLDADGTVLIDLFTTFGVSAQTEIDFDLDNASPADGALRKQCSAVIRLIEDELGGLAYTNILAQCSSQFFDDLTAHSEFRATFLNQIAAAGLRERIARRRVDFGGITFEEYRGKVGGTKYVADDKAHIFPLGVSELYLTRYAPAEYFDTVNTIGLPRYARMNPDGIDGDSKRTLRVQSQVFHICTRPRVLIPAKRT